MSRSRLRTVVLPLLGAVLVAALAAVALSRAVETFQPLGFVAERAGAGFLVTEVLTPSTGLDPGDQILLVDGADATSATVRARLTSQEASELVVLREGALETVRYLRPSLDLDWPYLFLAAIGVLYLLIGVYTVLREPRREATLFYLWCLASAAVYLLTDSGVGDTTGRVLYATEEIARALLPPLTLHLFLIFPTPLRWTTSTGTSEPTDGPRPRRRRLAFLYVPAAALLGIQLSLIGGTGRGITLATAERALPLLDRLTLLHLVLFSALALGVLTLRLYGNRREALDEGRLGEDWEERRQLQWIALGMGAGYAPFLVLYLLPWVLGARLPELVASVAVLPLALVPLTFAWAILRYKLWDLQLIVRDTVSTALTVVLAGGVFALAHLGIDQGVPEHLANLQDLLTFGTGAAIAGLLIPTRRRLGTLLERFQYGSGALAKRRALSRIGRELLEERDLAILSREFLESVEEAVETPRANLYLTGGQGGLLVPVRPQPDAPAALVPEELGEELWERRMTTLTGVALPGFQATSKTRLFLAGYRSLFPLTVSGKRVGVLALGHREGGAPLTSEDMELVGQLLGSVALAIENARLLDQLRHHLDEVTELQQFSQGIIESSPAGIAVLDRDGTILSTNGPFAELVGEPRDRLAGRRVGEVLPVEPLPETGSGLLEVSYCDPAGAEHHLQLSTSTYAAGHGEASRDLTVLLVHDVSERVAMERALREKDRLAALGVLAAGVAHEVNTPITGISSYAQMLLADTPEDDPRREILQKVERQTFRAARIVNNLLDFARNRDEESRPVDLVPVVREALDLLDTRRAKKGVRLEFELPDEPLVILGSDGEMQQVLTNLCLNSLDAMPEGGTLTVSAERRDGRALVTIQDTGTGISPTQLEKIFEPFFSTKLQRGGTGLGLPISHDIIQRHGGDIHVESDLGTGTRFCIELPLHPGRPDDDPGDSPRALTPPTT